MASDQQPARRMVLQNGLLAGLAAFFGNRLPVYAANSPPTPRYTIIPTGNIKDKTERLQVVTKKYEKLTQDDADYIDAFGEKLQLESDLVALKKNQGYVSQLKQRVDAGEQRFPFKLSLPVPNMEQAVIFWTQGCGALVLSTKLVDGQNVTRIAFGPASLQADDGGKFSLELMESSTPSRMGEATSVVQYLQLGIPVFRLSKVMASGGQIESAYGWTKLEAPGGIQLRVKVADRRDPFQFVALRTSNLKRTKEYYESLGMITVQTTQKPRMKRLDELTINSNSLFEPGNVFEPDREIGSVLLGFDGIDDGTFSMTSNKTLSTGILLLPPERKNKLEPVPSSVRFSVLGSPPGGQVSVSPDGLPTVFADNV